MKLRAINAFVGNIEMLLNGEEVNLYESLIDSSFEYIAAEILSHQLRKGIWYDGTEDLKYRVINSNTIEFSGNMHVCLNQDKFWNESFLSIVTDERCQGNGVNIFVRVGKYEGKSDLFKIDWKYKNT